MMPADGMRAVAKTETSARSDWQLAVDATRVSTLPQCQLVQPKRRAALSANAHLFRDRTEHARALMAAPVFKKLVRRARHRHLVIEELRRGPEARQIFHRRTEDAHMGRMGLRPAFQRGQTLP